MFYVNNELVKGIFLNGRNYNYLAYGFGKIIPEDRTAVQLNLNLAHKYLNQYRIEYGTVKDGYENALVSPRIDSPDYNGIFHTPFTYYYNGNIIPTKEVNVLVNNAYWALSNASVYNDININGNITYFADNTDFLGHNVNVFPEGVDEPIYKARLNQSILSNCTNFSFDIQTRFSKQDGYPSVDNCNNFSGNFKYVGSADSIYPGFRGFLHECKDGVFNIDCTNMHGGGNDANVTNYYNFSCISNSNNIKLDINGSPWQAWVHHDCYSNNCNITTKYIVPGFDHMNHCNFNLYIPRYADVEKSAYYSILSNSYNCNVYFDGTNSNISNFRNGNYSLFLFEDLNNCNLNLALRGSTGMNFSLGTRLDNCNIKFNNISTEYRGSCWYHMNNCNIYGDVTKAESRDSDLVAYSTNVNLNVNASLTNVFSLIWRSSYINGNAILGNKAYMTHSNNIILNLYNGNTLEFPNINDSKFKLYNVNNVSIDVSYNTNFDLYNAVGTAVLRNLNNVKFVEHGGANYTITNIYNCYNSFISANTISNNMLISNVYNSNLRFDTFNLNYNTLNVVNSHIFGFPRKVENTYNCVFIPQNLEQVVKANSLIGRWSRLWPYKARAGIMTIWNIGNCIIDADSWILGGNITYYERNYMETNIVKYYDGIATVDLTPYNLRTRLYIHCNTLNLGITGLPDTEPHHGFEDASISASNIYGKNNGIDGAYCVYARSDTRIYCEDFCNATIIPNITSGRPPVILINNYLTTNSYSREFACGLTRIGRINYLGGKPFRPNLNDGACLFINNTLLDGAFVNNSLLFVGSNVTWTGSTQITIGNGLIVNLANWRDYEGAVLEHINGKELAWNVWDSGPWGSQSLFDFCINV